MHNFPLVTPISIIIGEITEKKELHTFFANSRFSKITINVKESLTRERSLKI